MAPSDPSAQDFAVASSARMMEIKAQQELIKEEQEKIISKNTYSNNTNNEENTLQSQNDISLNTSA